MFSSNPNNINLKTFPNNGGIYRLQKNYKKYSVERYTSQESMEIWEGVFLTDNKLLDHFDHPDFRVEIFFKKREQQKVGSVGFEIGNIDTPLHTCIESWRKFYVWPACFFIVFLVTKNSF